MVKKIYICRFLCFSQKKVRVVRGVANGKTPRQTFLKTVPLAKGKMLSGTLQTAA